MTIFNNVKKGFSFYWKDFKLFFQKSSGLANCKPVLAYPDAGIDLSQNPRRYAGLSPNCLLYTSPSPRDRQKSRMPSSA